MEGCSVEDEGQVGPPWLENLPVLHLTETVRPFETRIVCAKWNEPKLWTVCWYSLPHWSFSLTSNLEMSCCEQLMFEKLSFYNNLKLFNQMALRNKIDVNIQCYFMERVAVIGIFWVNRNITNRFSNWAYQTCLWRLRHSHAQWLLLSI